MRRFAFLALLCQRRAQYRAAHVFNANLAPFAGNTAKRDITLCKRQAIRGCHRAIHGKGNAVLVEKIHLALIQHLPDGKGQLVCLRGVVLIRVCRYRRILQGFGQFSAIFPIGFGVEHIVDKICQRAVLNRVPQRILHVSDLSVFQQVSVDDLPIDELVDLVKRRKLRLCQIRHRFMKRVAKDSIRQHIRRCKLHAKQTAFAVRLCGVKRLGKRIAEHTRDGIVADLSCFSLHHVQHITAQLLLGERCDARPDVFFALSKGGSAIGQQPVSQVIRAKRVNGDMEERLVTIMGSAAIQVQVLHRFDLDGDGLRHIHLQPVVSLPNVARSAQR